jgi:hypothetical protein
MVNMVKRDGFSCCYELNTTTTEVQERIHEFRTNDYRSAYLVRNCYFFICPNKDVYISNVEMRR